MDIRVGIDLNGDNWIDWEGESPPNLIPDALWFGRFNTLAINGTVVADKQQSETGLIKHVFAAGSGAAKFSFPDY